MRWRLRANMTDIHDLVPKNKFDSSNIERLKHLTDNEIEPILPSLLEWIQDCNWPVAGDILPVLALHQSALVPLIHRVLSPHEKDDIWKYWIITCLVPLFSDESMHYRSLPGFPTCRSCWTMWNGKGSFPIGRDSMFQSGIGSSSNASGSISKSSNRMGYHTGQ